jgi:hypothetical protein
VITGSHKKCRFEEFNASHRPNPPEGELLSRMVA